MSILVENLPSSVDESDIRELFSSYGSCTVSISRDEAIVIFSYPQEAIIAYDNIQDKELQGTKLKLTKMFVRNKPKCPLRKEKKVTVRSKEDASWSNPKSLLKQKVQRSKIPLGYKTAKKTSLPPSEKELKERDEDNVERVTKNNTKHEEKKNEEEVEIGIQLTGTVEEGEVKEN